MVADRFAAAEWEGISLSHKGFDASVGSRLDANLFDMLKGLTAQGAAAEVPSGPVVRITKDSGSAGSPAAQTGAQPGTVGSVRPSQVVPVTTKALRVRRQRVVVGGLPVSVSLTRPAYGHLDLAITPARTLKSRHFAGGLDWNATQKTEE